jgi:hypothetical protein
MQPARDPRRATSGRRATPGTRRSARPGDPEVSESRRYARPKKSNTALIAAIGGGAALLLAIAIVAMSSGSGSTTRYRSRTTGPGSNGPESASGAPQYGGGTSQGRPLTAEERQQIVEADRKKSEALGIRDRYFEKRTGSLTLRSEYDGQKSTVRGEIDRAISLFEDYFHVYERVSEASRQNLLEGGRDAQDLKGLKAIRREMNQ